MTHFGDLLYQGDAITGITSDNNGGFGFGPLVGVYLYDITPVQLLTTSMATTATNAGAGNITLTAGTGVTSGTLPDGTTGIILDVPRNVTLTSTGNYTGGGLVTFTITGFDAYGQLQTATLATLNNNTVGTAIAFKSVKSVAHSGAIATGVSVGMGDVFGLPLVIGNVGQLLTVRWNSTLAQDAGTFVAGAATTNVDDRGTYTPSSASNGTRRLMIYMAPTAAQVRSGARSDVLGF
jgi:hypothetical protein